jgi:hypothetical protein
VTENDDLDRLLSPAQAAERGGVAEGFIRRSLDSGVLVAENSGSHRAPRVRAGVLAVFLAERSAYFAAERAARGW